LSSDRQSGASTAQLPAKLSGCQQLTLNRTLLNHLFLMLNMRILFLDQSGQLGGAELCLLDLASYYQDRCLVALFESGPFHDRLKQSQIPVQVLSPRPLEIRKSGGFWQGLRQLDRLIPLIQQVIQLSRQYDVIYANTPKALIVGAIASLISRKPLVYHLHDIISADHFSRANQTLMIILANTAKLVIANSQAAQQAFIQAGGKTKSQVVYNGFVVDRYNISPDKITTLRQQLQVDDQFVVGHFSRLSPWKGQHILLAALAACPANVTALFVGDALFGEDEYVQQLHQQVEQLGLKNRVQFLGFREDIPALMRACNLVAHTSTAPEPFGRVIIEAMLSQRPIVAAAAGGVMELIEHDRTGWLSSPGDVAALTSIIIQAQTTPIVTAQIAQQGHQYATTHFQLLPIQQQIAALIADLSLPNDELTTNLCV
jgi:glycosyltransferase involved in cell wall biosynthesis